MCLATNKTELTPEEFSDTASWTQPTKESFYLCTFCQYEAKKKLFYCPGCDREMLNHA